MKQKIRILLAQLIFLLTGTGFSQTFFEETIVFQPSESGYACFIIPAIISALNGDLLQIGYAQDSNSDLLIDVIYDKFLLTCNSCQTT